MSDLLQRILAFNQRLSDAKLKSSLRNDDVETFKLLNGNEITFSPRLQVGAIALIDGIGTSGIETLEDGRQIQILPGSIVHKVCYDRLTENELREIQDENNKQQEYENKIHNIKDYLKQKNLL